MKRKIIMPTLIAILAILILTKAYISREPVLVENIVSEETVNNANSNIKINIYDPATNKIIAKDIEVTNKEFLTKTDLINLVLNNSSYLKSTMTLLSVYEVDKETLIVLSNEFNKLSKISFIGTSTAIKDTLKNILGLDNINVKIEGNL